MQNLRNRSFLTLLDFSQKEVEFLLNLAEDLKHAKYIGNENLCLKIKILLSLLKRLYKNTLFI